MLATTATETQTMPLISHSSGETISTEAWVLYAGEASPALHPQPAQLRREQFIFNDIDPVEVLAEAVCGCWEANMTHALERRPVDICRQRQEERVVIGNAGVVRILRIGSAVTTVKPGDLCIIFCNGVWDARGYPIKILAYDAPGTMGMLARRLKLHQQQVIAIPQPSPYTLPQWAAFSLRYPTAWANWHVSYKCWEAQMGGAEPSETYVAAWGGGVALAQCTLARHVGCQALLIASSDERLATGRAAGLTMIDRRRFHSLEYDPARYQTDAAYRQSYQTAEKVFIQTMQDHTQGAGISIFIDNIGTPVYRATLKSLSRQGVITTCGWKHGMEVTHLRALECINRHIHVHTHYARYAEGVASVHFAHEHGWLPTITDGVYDWEAIPQLANDYAAGRIDSYFPIFWVLKH